MWSVGCILAELLKDQPLFPAEAEFEVGTEAQRNCRINSQ